MYNLNNTCHWSYSMLFSIQIMEDIDHYNIPIYNFPFDPEEDDEETVEENGELRVIYIIYIYVL